MGLVLSFGGGHFEVSVSFMSSKDWILCPHFSLMRALLGRTVIHILLLLGSSWVCKSLTLFERQAE